MPVFIMGMGRPIPDLFLKLKKLKKKLKKLTIKQTCAA